MEEFLRFAFPAGLFLLFFLMFCNIASWKKHAWVLAVALAALSIFGQENIKSIADICLLAFGTISVWKKGKMRLAEIILLIAIIAGSLFSLHYFYDYPVTIVYPWIQLR